MSGAPAQCALHNDSLSLEVSALGAEMQFLRTAAGDDLLWHGDGAFWTGRAPVLFPIVGRAVDDEIAVGAHRAKMPQHGFARRSLFELITQEPTACRHRLTQSAQTRALYSFDFTLDVTHRLEGAKLCVTATVTNLSATDMPFGFGFHPAFCWPLPQSRGAAHFVTLASGGSPARALLEDGLLRPAPVAGPFTDGVLEVHDALFKDGALVFPNGTQALRFGPRTGPALAFTFDNLPDLALWRPMGAPFLCIEPWHGTASYLGDGAQIAARPNALTLAPQAQARFGYSVELAP